MRHALLAAGALTVFAAFAVSAGGQSPRQPARRAQVTREHGSTFTHIDALCHGDDGSRVYNGFPLAEAVRESGCAKTAIDTLKGGVVTRGILLDVPRLKGVAALDPGSQVFVEDIEAWEKQAGVKVGSGDALLLHTGRWATGRTSGFDVSVAPWLKARDVALIGSDSTLDAGRCPERRCRCTSSW